MKQMPFVQTTWVDITVHVAVVTDRTPRAGVLVSV